MMPRVPALRATAVLVLVCAALAGGSVDAMSQGPEPGTSGVPAGAGFLAEQTCIACHATHPANPDDRGRIALRGLPDRYTPGARYSLTFAIAHPDADRKRWGFQITAVTKTTFARAGSFNVTDAVQTQVLTTGPQGRDYVEHTFMGTGIGRANGHEWQFDWVAPKTDVGAVAFYGVGSASNMDGAKEGDYIFTAAPEPLAIVSGPGGASPLKEVARGDR